MNRIWQKLPSMLYDWITTIREARSRGDFGVGQFSALDGELIVADGAFDRARADAGVAGALTAKLFSRAGFRVPRLEAGPATAETLTVTLIISKRFMQRGAKARNRRGPRRTARSNPTRADLQSNKGYFVQQGNYPTLTLAAFNDIYNI